MISTWKHIWGSRECFVFFRRIWLVDKQALVFGTNHSITYITKKAILSYFRLLEHSINQKSLTIINFLKCLFENSCISLRQQLEQIAIYIPDGSGTYCLHSSLPMFFFSSARNTLSSRSFLISKCLHGFSKKQYFQVISLSFQLR